MILKDIHEFIIFHKFQYFLGYKESIDTQSDTNRKDEIRTLVS